MYTLSEKYRYPTSPLAEKSGMVIGDRYRITVLTSRLLRLEYQEDGKFNDSATQVVINRDFPVPEFRVIESEEQLEIITEAVHLTYNKGPFSNNGLRIQVKGNLTIYHSVWYYGDEIKDLRGTARTLDEADGAVPLEHGLLSRYGFTVLDDSKSLCFREDGFVTKRDYEGQDLYFFGYGRDYLGCLKDFYYLCGKTPMIPRYALGNWWSRFYPYTDEEYKKLILRFEMEKIPFSIAVIDMDWHLTDVDPKYGSGWTGYTWNRKLFTDPKEFLTWLHEKGLHVTLNIHPADGVRAFEEQYYEMAKELGVDYEKEDPIPLDVTNPQFIEAYFKHLYHPNEDRGVDFWWIDWQQGGHSKIEGLDPLWMLNHYHYLDHKSNRKRALTFSRYAGIGSHRYPIGFSGDTFATWESLDFQPYFTANASNAGYGWWSHDIGGHMHGDKDDEMVARWIQFGVFSPIMRIHSSNSPFFMKEPWKYNRMAQENMKYFLNLRHQLVPYLYTMNWRFHTFDEPLIQPMYYKNPEVWEAYEIPNEYYFGTELIVCPITKPMNPKLNLGCFDGWLPEGMYYDFFLGRRYEGGRRLQFYRGLNTMPIFAKAGGIIVLAGEETISNELTNPEHLEVRIYAGDNGEFQLFEDNSFDESAGELKTSITNFSFAWGEKAQIHIEANETQEGVVPEKRSYRIGLYGVVDTNEIQIYINNVKMQGFEKTYHNDTHKLEIQLREMDSKEKIQIVIDSAYGTLAHNNKLDEIFVLLDNARIAYDLKDTIYRMMKKHENPLGFLSEIQSLHLSEQLYGAIKEILTSTLG